MARTSMFVLGRSIQKMKMMQIKRRSIACRSSNPKVVSSKTRTILKPSITAQTKKSNCDSKVTQFKTPPTKSSVLSPTRADRVEMLKAKFSGTILKAQQTLFSNSSNIGHRVVVAAPKICSIQQQRQAAKEALDKIEPIFDFNANLDAMREFEKLIGVG
ncbi:unnamed protein product [Citrullus colocynthis]|uniref:Uncharacterized protein n=1 Tax=Citrullus colocynthis TaxID=252529 RepID=A0ABP0XYQ7_9ROSI